MKPMYINVTADPIIVTLNTHSSGDFNVSVRLGGASTLEFALENPDDAVASNTYTQPVGPAPVWLPAPAASDGVVKLNFPVSALRFTGVGQSTVLQHGIV